MKWFFLSVIILLWNISTMSQTFYAGDDQSICAGDISTLQGTGPASWDYTWTSVPNDPTISNPNILTPTIGPLNAGVYVYTLTGTTTSTTNLIPNGNFDLGYTDFTSDYDYCNTNNCLFTPPANGVFGVDSDPSFLHSNFPSSCSSPVSGDSMIIANGPMIANTTLYQITVNNINPNTDYKFSTWLTNMSLSVLPAYTPNLQFEINGVIIGSKSVPLAICDWTEFTYIWDSESATSAEIRIIDLNITSTGIGNDFAIDDVALYEIIVEEDNCTVTVIDVPTSTFSLSSQMCMNDTALITYTGNAPPAPTADYRWDFGIDATIISGSGEGPYNIQWTSSGTKTVSLSVEAGCESDTTYIDIQVNQNPDISITANATSIPYGTNTTLQGHMSGNPGPLQFTWEPVLMLTNPNNQNPTTVTLEDDIYYFFEVTDQTTSCTSIDSILIQITGGAFGILSATGTPDTICPGQTTNLHINVLGGSGSYDASWTSDPPGYIGSGLSVDASPIVNTTYFVEVGDGFNTLYDTIDIIVLQETVISTEPQDNILIIGATAQFNVIAEFALDYQWQESTDNGNIWIDLTNVNEYSGVNSPTLTINPIDITMDENLYQCIISGNCDTITSSQAELSVFSSPDFIGSFYDIIVCVDDTFSIACNDSSFLQIIDFNLSIEFNNNKIKYLDITNIASEIATNTIVTTIGNSITVSWNSSQDVTISDGNLFQLTFVALEDGTSSLSWNRLLSSITNQAGQQPTMVLTDGNIVSNPLAIAPTNAYADNDTINIVDEINILLTADGGSGDELIWSSNNCGGDTVGTGTPLEIMRPIATTTYYANWYNQCGSSACSEVQIVILYNYNVGIPNAFTPNGDGLNDEFEVVSNTTLDDFRMQIFSRWGELIFESTDQLVGWDGIYKGNNLSTNSYSWKISYYFSNDGANYYNVAKTGTVMLIR